MSTILVFAAVVQAGGAIVLIGVTWWYARTTAEMARAIGEQSALLRLAAEIQARAALYSNNWGDNSPEVLVELARDLAAQRRGAAYTGSPRRD